MTIKEIIRKFINGNRRENYVPEKITPDEVKLQSYINEERKARIKRLVNYYEKKRERDYWTSKKILQGSRYSPSKSSVILKGGRNI